MQALNDVFFIIAQVTAIIAVIMAALRFKFSDEVSARRFICLILAIMLFQVMNIALYVKEIANAIVQR